MAIGPNVVDDTEGMTEEEYWRGMAETMPDFDRDAIAWAYGKLQAFGVGTNTSDSAMMMDRLSAMLGA